MNQSATTSPSSTSPSLRRRWAFPVGIILACLVALALRVPELTMRPMHGDEAVHAIKLKELWFSGDYKYDPEEYHGPSLYYFTVPILWLTGAQNLGDVNEIMLRIVPALFGAGLVLLLWLIADGLGRWSAFWAGVLTAISPAMSYYSRYYIQETLLVFFAFAGIVAAWRYTRSGKLIWCLLAGACLGMMHATKETWVLSLFAMLLAAPITLYWTRWVDGKHIEWRPHIRPKDKIRALILGGVVAALLFSSFLANPRGPVDSVIAYQTYLGRGGTGTIHRHPWNWYLEILGYSRASQGPIFSSRLPWNYNLKPPIAWSEGFILALAVVGLVAALAHKGIGRTHLSLMRFIAFYTIILTVIYCLIPYKTPWCALNFLHGMILLAGFGAVALIRVIRMVPLQVATCLLLLAGGAQLASQAYAANFKFFADRRNPYVYAHPVIDVTRLANDLDELAQVSPEGYKTTICVFSPGKDYWPLPWYLRRFTGVGYWADLKAVQPDQRNAVLKAPIIITTMELQEEFEQKLSSGYHVDLRVLRPDAYLIVFIRNDLWEAFIKRRTGEQDKNS